MDMYQKRKMRKEKNVKKDEELELNNKMNINWVMLFYGNTMENADISIFL